VSLVGKLKPDVLLLDLKMPDQDGLAVLSELGGAESPVRTIVLTASEDERDYVETVRRGARGIVLKQAATERLLEGIRKVHRGEIWIDQRVAAEVVKAMSRPAAVPHARGEKGLLTPREGEVVALVTQGFRNKEIADKLSISEQTVKNHLQNIYDKLGVSDRLELALYALHHKLAQPG
jgi:DNA-binding NarL/FixJ family response regulator